MRDKTVVFRSLSPEEFTVDAPCRFAATVDIPQDLLSEGTYRATSNMYAVHNAMNYSLKADAIVLHAKSNAAARESTDIVPLISAPLAWDIDCIAAGAG
jgi:hypothetical protein